MRLWLKVFAVLLLGLFPKDAALGREDFQFQKLDNGLELYILEDHTVPLVTLQIIFRTGALIETQEYDGLSHLFEHMLFKANELHGSQEEFYDALNKLGCSNVNGGTSVESVTYFATVPATQLENIIKFWAYTVRTNRIIPEELEKEKEVVLNEIEMHLGNPQEVLVETLNKLLYGEHCSRKNVIGSKDVIRSCTIEQLEWLKKNYYLPNNAALFITGDVLPRTVINYVHQYFGDWSRGQDPFKTYPLPKYPPLTENKTVIVPNFMSTNFFFWGFRYPGPDIASDPENTYVADVLVELCTRLSGPFLTALEDLIWQKESIIISYVTQRNGAVFDFILQILVEPEINQTRRMIELLRNIIENEFKQMSQRADYFSAEEIAWAIQSIEAKRLYRTEVSINKAYSASLWWASSSTDYYQTYLAKLRGVTAEDIKSFVQKYLYQHNRIEFFWIDKLIAQEIGLEVGQ